MRTFVLLNLKDGVQSAVNEAWGREETLEEHKAFVRVRKHLGQESLTEDALTEVSCVSSDQAAYVTSLAINSSSRKEFH